MGGFFVCLFFSWSAGMDSRWKLDKYLFIGKMLLQVCVITALYEEPL